MENERRMKTGNPIDHDEPLYRRALPVICLCIALIVLVVLLWYLVDVLLLAFAGILFAIMLRTPADELSRRSGISAGWSLTIVVVVLATLAGASGWLFGRALFEQLSTLMQTLPEITGELRSRLADFGWTLSGLDLRQWLAERTTFLKRGIDVVVATFGALANLVIVLVVGLFFAAQPRLYIGGFAKLFPPRCQPRTEEVFNQLGHTLRWWLLGQLLLMVIIAIATGVGLWALGVPLAFALAVIAGLLEFIPYLGPLLAAVPALLVALSESPMLAGKVLLLYVAIQSLEGYLLQPLVQQRTVYLPPAMVLLSQVILGILIGTLGVILATPIAASFLVLTRTLYVQDVLGQDQDQNNRP
jgi:predicted PurR-regulated permease PerM